MKASPEKNVRITEERKGLSEERAGYDPGKGNRVLGNCND